MAKGQQKLLFAEEKLVEKKYKTTKETFGQRFHRCLAIPGPEEMKVSFKAKLLSKKNKYAEN